MPTHQRLSESAIAVVDVETTGATAAFERVIEVGVVRIERMAVVERYQQLIHPARRVPAFITQLTGISPEMLENAPGFAEQLPGLKRILGDAVVVGHNVRFDLGFLNAEFARADENLPVFLRGQPILDTVRLARKRFGRGGNGLSNLCKRLNVTIENAHRALADAQATAEVLLKLAQLLQDENPLIPLTINDLVQAQGGAIHLRPFVAPDVLASRVGPKLPPALAVAIASSKLVRLTYLDGSREQTVSVVKPQKIVKHNNANALLCFCHLHQRQRTIKLERLISVEPIQTERFHEPTDEPSFDFAD